MKPSVKLVYKDKTYQTPTVNEGGFSPKWYHTFDIKIDSLEDEKKQKSTQKFPGEHISNMMRIWDK